MRRLTLLIVAAATASLAAMPASAQYSEDLVVSDSTLPPGSPVTISGHGFKANTKVTLTLGSPPILVGTATTDGSGAFEATVIIPADTPPGSHTLKATGAAAGGGELVLAQPIEVAGELATTGQDLAAWLVIGLGFLGVGAAFVGVRARRTRVADAAH